MLVHRRDVDTDCVNVSARDELRCISQTGLESNLLQLSISQGYSVPSTAEMMGVGLVLHYVTTLKD